MCVCVTESKVATIKQAYRKGEIERLNVKSGQRERQKLFVLVYDAFKISTTFLKDISLIPVADAVCFNKKKPEQTTSHKLHSSCKDVKYRRTRRVLTE